MSTIKLGADSGGGTVALKGPASTTLNAHVELKLPVADGSANQILATNGSGQLQWADDTDTTNTNASNLASGTLPAARIADDSIVEAKLDIHAAPSGTDKFLGYTSNGMEWATAGNATWTKATKVALSGAASREFTGIPATAQGLIFGWDGMSHGASVGASSDWYIQVGTGSTTYATSGYKMQAFAGGGYTGGSAEYTDSIEIGRGSTQAAEVLYGHCIMYHLGDNIWTIQMQSKAAGDNWSVIGFGTVTLGAALSAIKTYTHYQANNYDAGTIYLSYLTYT